MKKQDKLSLSLNNLKEDLPIHHPDSDFWNQIESNLDDKDFSISWEKGIDNLAKHQPNPKLWNTIEDQLDRKNRFLAIKIISGIAASLIIGMVGFQIFKSPEQGNQLLSYLNHTSVELNQDLDYQSNINLSHREINYNVPTIELNTLKRKTSTNKIIHKTNTNKLITLSEEKNQVTPTDKENTGFSTKIQKEVKNKNIETPINKNLLSNPIQNIHQEYQNKEKTKKDIKANSNWSLSAALGQEYLSAKNNNNSRIKGHGLKIGLAYTPSKLIFRSGFEYTNYELDERYISSVNEKRVIDGKTRITTTRIDNEITNNYSFIKIPLTLGYKLLKEEKWFLNIHSGLNIQLFFDYNRPKPTFSKAISRVNYTQSQDLSPSKNLDYQILLELESGYNLGKAISVFGKPCLKFYPGRIPINNVSNQKLNYSLGLDFGIHIDL
ncbi:MAG: hypothetical protein ACEPOW_07040 [Bacteroidales bacterium]